MNKDFLKNINLEEMRSVDPRTVDKSKLKDIKDIHINKHLSGDERFCEYIKQIRNPYCYLDNGIVVKISFSGGEPFEEIVKRIIANGAG